MDDIQTFESLMSLADELPDGNERIMIREKAINSADLSGNEEDMYDARIHYIEDVGTFGGYSEKYFGVFPWLLHYAQHKGGEYERRNVLWYYKWIIMEMGSYPSVTRAQIESALEDLRRRYLDFGSNEKVYHQYAYIIYAYDLQDMEKARYHYNKWLKFRKRDELDDCEACVINRHVSYLVKDGNIKKAHTVAEPVLLGRESCKHVPKDTWSKLLLPMYLKGDFEVSKLYAEKLGRKVTSMKYNNNLGSIQVLIIYHTKAGNFAKALGWLEKGISSAITQKEMNGKFWFFTAAAYLFSHLPKETIKLKLPTIFPLFTASANYHTISLRDWFNTEADSIANLFDKRNGNNGFLQMKLELLNF